MRTIEDKISFLRECANAYETTGKSKISDLEYDALYAEVQAEDPNNDFFDEVGGLDDRHIYGTKVTHKVIMGSLQKSPNVEDFHKWLTLTYPNIESVSFVVQHKVDGLSLGCIYKNGKLQMVVTRGDGLTGVDVTKNAKFVGGIPETINCKDEVEIRGECYKDRVNFYKEWVGEYENPRNFTSGAINQKEANVTKERGLDFIAYEIVRKDFATENDKMVFLKENGFKNLNETTVVLSGNYKQISDGVKKYMDNIHRDTLSYSIDGVVVKLMDIKKVKEMGYVSEGRKPRSNKAVKFPCEQVSTTIEGVEYSVGRIGSISIVGLLKPVRLNETTVKRVSLHNFKFIQELDLKIGSEILLQKSGEIIPYVVRKISDRKDATDIVIPTVCPSCKEKLEWDSTHTTKFCYNSNCPSQLVSKIDHWFKTIGVKGIGEGIINKLVHDLKKVTCLADMYNLSNHKSLMGDYLGRQATENILNAVTSVKELTLAKFIEALGIGKIGSMSSKITDMAGTIEAIDKITAEDLIAIDGFAEIKASNFVEGWKFQRNEISKLLEHVNIKEKQMKKGSLDGKSFCITGTLSKGRKEFVALIEDNGGRFSSSVTAKLDFLICGDDCGSKKDKAEKLGVKILEESEFMAMIA